MTAGAVALDDAALAETLGMLQCWSSGWVEPVVATPEPRHIAAQQILAAALQTRRVPLAGWQRLWGDLPLFGNDGQDIMDHLLAQGFSLKEIGDHLGHRLSKTTAVYAKVNLTGLREVANLSLGGLL